MRRTPTLARLLALTISALTISSLTILGAAGCCITPPAAERYFDRATPMGTVKMFQYAVETKQFATAYACMTPRDHEEMGLSLFKITSSISMDQIAGYSLREFLENAIRSPADIDGDAATVYLDCKGETGFWAVLIRSGDEWRVDMYQTLSNFHINPE